MGRGSLAKVRDAHDRQKRKKARLKRAHPPPAAKPGTRARPAARTKKA